MSPCTRLATVVLVSSLAMPAAFAQQDSGDFNLELHAHSQTTAADIGVPSFPGAKPYKDPNHGDHDSGTVDLGFTFGDTVLRLQVATYQTSEPADHVLGFYRKALSRYGEVLECDHGHAVGPLTVTRSGLTCDTTHSRLDRSHVQFDAHDDSSNDHELRAGSPEKFRIAAISDESRPGATRFSLVYLQIPRDDGSRQPD